MIGDKNNSPQRPADSLGARTGLTLPTWITIFRLLLIPLFVFLAILYGRTVQQGNAVETWRYLAIVVFVVASVSDFLDGYLARKLNQKSRIGSILDPIADKGLMLAALVTLTFSGWHYNFPLWFTVLVISRDLFILAGVAVLHLLIGKVHIQPTRLGKLATAMLMPALAWVMLQISYSNIVILISGVITLLSAIDYFLVGIRHLRKHGHDETARH